MSLPRAEPAGTVYRLRVAGRLDPHWADWFGDLTLTREDDGATSLTGVVADQAALHGLLTKIRDLGVTLLSVAVVGAAAETPEPVARALTPLLPSGDVPRVGGSGYR